MSCSGLSVRLVVRLGDIVYSQEASGIEIEVDAFIVQCANIPRLTLGNSNPLVTIRSSLSGRPNTAILR